MDTKSLPEATKERCRRGITLYEVGGITPLGHGLYNVPGSEGWTKLGRLSTARRRGVVRLSGPPLSPEHVVQASGSGFDIRC